MILMPIVYVTDMSRSRSFYERLGFELIMSSEWWSELRAGDGAVLALHKSQDPPTDGSHLELAMVATEHLETVLDQLTAHGVAIVGPIASEEFGRSMKIIDPDGLVIQISEHDPDLYDDGNTVVSPI